MEFCSVQATVQILFVKTIMNIFSVVGAAKIIFVKIPVLAQGRSETEKPRYRAKQRDRETGRERERERCELKAFNQCRDENFVMGC